ncbi:MAG: hypothetical protein R6W81_01990, partial [Bacteroidales bacterium]
MTATGGSPPFAYLWSNGSTTEDLSNIPSGIYSVIITDINSVPCTISGIEVTQPDPLDPGAHNTNTITVCVGYNPPELSLTTPPSGGTEPYSYEWYENDELVSNSSSYNPDQLLIAIDYVYYCIVSDACGQSENTESKTIHVVDDAIVWIDGAGTYCQDAIITLESHHIAGTGTILIEWQYYDSSVGWTPILDATEGTYNPPSETSGQFSYRVHFTINGAACNDPYSNSVLVEVNESPEASITAQTNVLCFGNSTAAVTVTANNGTSPYNYSLDGGAFLASGTFSGLSAGNYTVTARDANNCTFDLPVTITQPAAALGALAFSNSPICENETLTLTGSAAGGTPGYSYLWSGPNGYSSNIQNPTIINAIPTATGNYTLIVTDDDGCTVSNNISVTVAALPITTGVTICQGGSGSLTSSNVCQATSPITIAPIFPITVNLAGTGQTWSNPLRIRADDNSYASSTIARNSNSQNLNAIEFDFNIPPDAFITGVQVTIGRYAGSDNSIQDNSIRLIVGGSATGEDKANSYNPYNVYWPTSETSANYGSSNDTWGLTLTPAQVNATNFGVSLSARSINNNRTANVDYVQISITYIIPGLHWYTTISGGEPVGKGSPFNPVGVTGSGLPDTNETGTYLFYAACASSPECRTATEFVILPTPAINLEENPSVCYGETTTSIPYTSPTESPDQYSIDYDAAANSVGFIDITDDPLPAGSIPLTIPANAPPATYNATLTVRNSTTENPDQYSIDYDAAANSVGFIDITDDPLPAGS